MFIEKLVAKARAKASPPPPVAPVPTEPTAKPKSRMSPWLDLVRQIEAAEKAGD